MPLRLPTGGAILLPADFGAHSYRLFGTVIIIDGITAERTMNRTADLEAALRFVIGRIEQEAARSGESLSEEQRFLLNNLPKDSVLSQPHGGDPEIPEQPIPRDTYIRKGLCRSNAGAPQ